MRLTGPQMQLAKKVMKSGKRGLTTHDMHTATLEALLKHKVVGYLANQRVVLIAPTRRVLKGATIRTVLDLDDTPRTPSFDMGVTT